MVDKDGSVLASPTAGQVGTRRSDPLLRQVARTGKPVAGALSADGTRHAYIERMPLLGRNVVFAEYRSSEALAAGVASFRTGLGMFVLLSLLIALPLFYVLGGRSVGALYRSALQRARRDGLTDLDNHRAFQDELARAVGEAVRYGTTVTLALLDIDDFKFENDRHGHQHGDRLLCELASLLREARAGDRAFRLGGDEFALLLAHTTEPEADVPLARIRAEVERRLSGVSASIGFSAAVPEDREPSSLWGRADAALLEAKRRGGNTIVAAAEVLDSVPVVTIEKVRAVRALIDAGAVDVAFQPIWDLSGTRVLGYEALARPRSAELSGPGEAFEIADSIGRGHELDAVCRRATLRLAGQLPPGALLFLNVSPQTLEHDAAGRRQSRTGGARRGLRARAGGARDHGAHRRPQGDPGAGGRTAARAGVQARARRCRRRQRGPRDAARPARRLHQDRPCRGRLGRRGPRGARRDARHHGLRARERLVRHRRGHRERGDAGARP